MALGLFGQDAEPEESPTALGCPDDPSGYTLRNDAIVRTPFNLLGLLDPAVETARADLPGQGDAFSRESALEGYRSLRKAFRAESGLIAPFRLTVVKTFYTDCSEDASGKKELDVVYEVFRFSLSPPHLRLFESSREQEEDPSRTAVDRQPPRSLSLRPEAAYNGSDGFGVGGELDYATGAPGLSTIAASGHKAPQGSDAAFSLEGSSDGWRWAEAAHWSVAYDYANGPSEDRDLRRSRGLAQFHATLRPLRDSIVSRIGSSFELGNQTSAIDVSEAPNTLSSTSYSSAKFFGGITARTRRHAYAASYGFQLGSARSGKLFDYYKHIADLAWDYRRPFGNHRNFEIESALLLGKLGVRGNVPVVERFFGGNVEHLFVPLEDWRVRSAPLIRSLPNRTLARLSENASVGGESYVALNLTLAATVWRLPLLPDEVSRDPEFQTALQTAEDGALASMITEYRAEVPRTEDERTALEPIIEAVPAVVSQLESLELENSDADWFECQFITEDIAKTASRLKTEPGDLGQVQAALDNAIKSCKEEEKITRGQADAIFGELNRLIEQMQTRYETRPEIQAATERANTDFKLPERAIEAFTKEMNLFSISPLFIFDAARIGPQASAAGGGMRYGIGGGVRFGLASHVNFDIGYAVNPKPQPWEGRGAFWFSMQFLELIR